MYFILFQNTYVWGNCPIKCSICFSVLRLTKHSKWIRLVLYAVLFVVICVSVATTIYLALNCKPLAANWDPYIPGATCLGPAVSVLVGYIYSALNITIDWIIATLPIFLLWQVRLEWKQKLTVIGVLSLGIFASCATLVRLRYFKGFLATKDVLCKFSR